ncbi:hypothetical protein [uncultured Desulfobacter sp.]|uniref:hypothetical protein n=1 Tax=uncultured Desulfobacter sp. TaxID=240139 RepID=UPI002AAC2EFF|nr:hypothetical protein [uncultured Desulfobacter sp.]
MELASLYRKKGELDKTESLINQWAQVPGNQVQKSADFANYFEFRGQFEKAEKNFLKLQ